ncbi:hypothetical protein U9M48_009983 [Paspalum notatum var. saurae]|uniref:F-box domain-containing protein n=1 Tax=Paspalum notatum var. saurae TaxID=547442 RepID=A0AAQ3SSF9_PASNO
MDLAAEVLPEDVLADVLGRLAPRWLAASRCVCRLWRDTVDSRGLLRADLLPRSVAGLFIHHSNTWMTSFLSRPSAGPPRLHLLGHCNGLVLLQDRVVNPATRQWARLPPRPPPPCAAPAYLYTDVYLVYDPAVSPHYELFSVPPRSAQEQEV